MAPLDSSDVVWNHHTSRPGAVFIRRSVVPTRRTTMIVARGLLYYCVQSEWTKTYWWWFAEPILAVQVAFSIAVNNEKSLAIALTDGFNIELASQFWSRFVKVPVEHEQTQSLELVVGAPYSWMLPSTTLSAWPQAHLDLDLAKALA